MEMPDGQIKSARIIDGGRRSDMKNVIMYVNQFYGGIGGEAQADYAPTLAEGAVGPGRALDQMIKGGKVTHTVICGDSYMAENTEQALEKIGSLLEGCEIDLFIAGPAFMSGRYGVSCAEACNYVHKKFNVPAVTCMYEENPGREMYPQSMYIVCGHNSGAGMKDDLPKMAALVNKFLMGEEILWAEKEGYFPRGIRRQIILPAEQTSAHRAVAMLNRKLAGEPFETELPISAEESVPIAPPRDASRSRVAFVSTAGLVPVDNPDHIPSAASTRFGRYDISGKDTLNAGEWRSVHGGYDPVYADAEPMLAMPLDALRELEREGKIGYLHPWFYSTTGNQTNRVNAVRMAKEIVEYLQADKIDTVIFGSA